MRVLAVLLALATLVQASHAVDRGVPWLNLTDRQLEELKAMGVPVAYFGGEPAIKIRFARVNAPEIFHPSSERELELGMKAKEYVERRLEEAGGYVRCRAYGLGKYHRVIADVYPDDSRVSLSDELVKKGLAEYRHYPPPAPLPAWFPREFKARVAKVVDGDTIWVYARNGSTGGSGSRGGGSSSPVPVVPVLPLPLRRVVGSA
ncbi:MAG: thermonuclease family protein [Methanopyri archaeon]|nr:thermonuclease family protein [Methanopyri archaeon]